MSEPRIIAIGAPPIFKQQVARALDASPEAVQWMSSATAAEGLLSENHGLADLVVMSPAVKEPDALGLGEYVARTSPATAVVLVRDKVLNGLLVSAMRSGIRDVVDLSRGDDDLRAALKTAVAWSENLRSIKPNGHDERPLRRAAIFSVFSSKGGTGKTFMATNLAAAIASRTKKETLVLDLDMDMGDVFSYFGREPNRSFTDLIAVGDQADRETILSTATLLNENLWGIAAPQDPAAVDVPGEAMGKVLRALRSNFDYVVIDGTAEYADHVLAAFDMSDAICLVAGLDVVGVRHLSVALETLLALGLPRERFRVVLNRADSKVGLDPKDVERVLKVRVDAMIPSSRLVPAALNRGRPVYLDEPDSEVARAVAAFADKLTDSTPVATEPRRFFKWPIGGN